MRWAAEVFPLKKAIRPARGVLRRRSLCSILCVPYDYFCGGTSCLLVENRREKKRRVLGRFAQLLVQDRGERANGVFEHRLGFVEVTVRWVGTVYCIAIVGLVLNTRGKLCYFKQTGGVESGCGNSGWAEGYAESRLSVESG